MWFRRIFNTKTDHAPRRTPVLNNNGAPELHLSADALRQLNRLQLHASRSLPGFGVGNRSSLRRKPAAEFREHRMYTPGDDVRFVDWRASARQEHIYIKQGERPKEATIHVLVDCSASMSWGKPPKANLALTLAAALSYMALAQGDRLVIVPLITRGPGGTVQTLGPVTGKGQFPGILNYLRALPFRGEIDLGRSLQEFGRRPTTRGGRVLLITDLLETENLKSGLESLPAPSWEVSIFHLLHPEEITPTVKGEFEMQDIETRQIKHYHVTAKALEVYQQRLQAWQESLKAVCHERKASYTLIPTNWTLEDEIISHLRECHLVKPL